MTPKLNTVSTVPTQRYASVQPTTLLAVPGWGKNFSQ